MTFDIDLHEVCVRVGGRAGVRYVITKFSRLDSLPNFLPMVLRYKFTYYQHKIGTNTYIQMKLCAYRKLSKKGPEDKNRISLKF